MINDNPAIVHQTNASKVTAMKLALKNGHLDMVKLLLQHGADIHFHSDNWQIIESAVKSYNLALVKYLVEKVGVPVPRRLTLRVAIEHHENGPQKEQC